MDEKGKRWVSEEMVRKIELGSIFVILAGALIGASSLIIAGGGTIVGAEVYNNSKK